MTRLDDHFNLIAGTLTGISDQINFAGHADLSVRAMEWFADPRLVEYDSKLFMYFNSGWHEPQNHQFLVELDPQRLVPLEPARELILKGERQKIEKNWMPFGDDLCKMVYSVTPHRILRLSLDHPLHIMCEEIACLDAGETDVQNRTPLRGGSPPQRVGDSYYSFCHAIYTDPEGYRYAANVYRFSATYPYATTHQPRHILALPNPLGRTRIQPQLNTAISEVIYPSGAVFHEEAWFVSYGINDEVCAIATLSMATVEQAMCPIDLAFQH